MLIGAFLGVTPRPRQFGQGLSEPLQGQFIQVAVQLMVVDGCIYPLQQVSFVAPNPDVPGGNPEEKLERKLPGTLFTKF